MIAGTPTIAALGASYAVGFSCFRAKTPNPDLLTALRAVRLRCGWMIDRDEENGRKYSTHQTRPSHTKFLTRLILPAHSIRDSGFAAPKSGCMAAIPTFLFTI